jgi:hypothetical protein
LDNPEAELKSNKETAVGEMQMPILSQTNTTIPIIEPDPTTTTPAAPPFGSDGVGPGAMIYVGIILAIIVVLVLSYRWYKSADRIKGEDVRPGLDDLDSSQAVLNQFLVVQGGMAIVITFGVVFSLQWILVMWPLTLTSSVAFVGMSVAVRSWAKDFVRDAYKNRYNLEGYMRDKKGDKRRYAWSNIEIKTPYILDSEMMAEIVEHAKEVTDKEGNKVAKDWDKKKLKEYEATPLDINNKYVVIVLTKGALFIEWVEWFDIDMFGDYSMPSAGPVLRHIATIQIVATDPLDPFYNRNEYVPVFVEIFGDRQDMAAVEALPSIDVEKDLVHIGLLKSAGVERKVAAGEANTDRAMLLDELNDKRDFSDAVEASADSKAARYAEDKERIGNLKKMRARSSPSLWVMAFLFIIGVLLGYTWGQNSILSQLYGTSVLLPGFGAMIYEGVVRWAARR